MAGLRQWARELKRQTLVVYFVARDPRTPWPLRLLALGIAAYALSPIDLIPDFIPLLGYLDDLVIVPLGLLLVLRRVPAEVLDDARQRAAAAATRPVSRAMAVIIVVVWVASLTALGAWLWRSMPA
ncbi:YkvA family protein [Stenotrophomonas sp. LARHCG68]